MMNDLRDFSGCGANLPCMRRPYDARTAVSGLVLHEEGSDTLLLVRETGHESNK